MRRFSPSWRRCKLQLSIPKRSVSLSPFFFFFSSFFLSLLPHYIPPPAFHFSSPQPQTQCLLRMCVEWMCPAVCRTQCALGIVPRTAAIFWYRSMIGQTRNQIPQNSWCCCLYCAYALASKMCYNPDLIRRDNSPQFPVYIPCKHGRQGKMLWACFTSHTARFRS